MPVFAVSVKAELLVTQICDFPSQSVSSLSVQSSPVQSFVLVFLVVEGEISESAVLESVS